MNGDFKYTGFAEYIAALNAASRDIDPAADKAVLAGGEVVFRDIVDHVAVDTGALQAHLEATGKGPLQHKGNMPEIEIGLLDLGAAGGGYGTARKGPRRKGSTRRGGKSYSRQFLYGVILEYGSSSMAAQPYIRPSFDNNHGRVVQAEIASLRADGMLP